MSYSISFPNMFNKSHVNLEKDYDAIKQDLILLLGSNKGGLYGDPWFGTEIKSILWDQAHEDIAVRIIKEQIYESIYSYMPNNVTINSNDIVVNIIDNYVNVQINLSAYSNKENDMLDISLLNENSIDNLT